MDLDLGADPVALARAFLGRPAIVGVLGVLVVLAVAGWRPGRDVPRHALAVPPLVAVLVGGGDIRLRALSGAAVVVLVLVVAALGVVVPRARPLWDTAATTPLLLATALGLFACLPETGGAITLAVGTATLLVVAPHHRPSAAGLAAVPVGVALVVAADGIRPGQVVGGVACLGMLAVLAVLSLDPAFGRRLARRLDTGRGLAVALVGHAAVVVAVARGPGIRAPLELRGYAVPLALALLTSAALALLPTPATGRSGPVSGA